MSQYNRIFIRGLSFYLMVVFIASVAVAQQPQLQAPWKWDINPPLIIQGNNGSYSHNECGSRDLDAASCTPNLCDLPRCAWENTWAIDIGLNDQEVLAPASGQVTFVKNNTSGLGGRELAVTHYGPSGAAVVTVYLHLSAIRVNMGDSVRQGQVIAISGRSSGGSETGVGPHLHFHIWSGSRDRDSHTQPTENLILQQVNVDPSFQQYNANNYDLNDSFISNQRFRSNNGNCGNGVSTYTINGNPPIHPAGTFVKLPDDPTVYLVQGPDLTNPRPYLLAISSPDVLRDPYRHDPGCGVSLFDFPDMIIISYDEFFNYDFGPDLTMPQSLPCITRANQNGKLIISSRGEISVISNGMRRPFPSEAMFVALGYPAYNFCRVVPDSTYDSYPQGPVMDGRQ